MKTPIERIVEAAFAGMPDGDGELWRVRFARAVAAEVLRELIAQEFSSRIRWATWHIGARECVNDFAASLGVDLNESQTGGKPGKE